MEGKDDSCPLKAEIQWKDGVPYTTYVPTVAKGTMEELHWAALSLPYQGKRKLKKHYLGEDDEGNAVYDLRESDDFLNSFEEEMHGRRVLEVIAMRKVKDAAEGSHEMIKYIEDRSLGKPTQTQHNLQVTGTLQDFFAELHALDVTDPLLPPPNLEVTCIEVSDDYEILDTDEDFVSVKIPRDQLLKDPLADL